MTSPVILLLAIVIVGQAVGSNAVPIYKCPRVCKCTNNFKTVNCDKRGLTDIPKDIPKCVEILNLSHNSFGELKNNSFPILPNLTALHMDVSSITGFQAHAFKGLTNLKQLFLLSNQFQEVYDKELCEDLPKVEELFLDRNKLTVLPDLGGCLQLKTLTMENNQLTSLKFPAGYSNLTRLSHLTMSLNDIKKLHKDDFQNLRNSTITRLLISRISLKEVENGTFDPISHSLQTLKISYNTLLNATNLLPIFKQLSRCEGLLSLDLDGLAFNSDLPPGIFSDFKGIPLRSLSLSNNEFGTIHSGTFGNFEALIHLNLKKSKIDNIEPTAFVGMNSLQHLQLAINNLPRIPDNLPPTLNSLILERNRITSIADNQLAKISNLKILNLHKNSIAKVNVHAFGGLERLEQLDLSDNNIDGLGRLTLSPLRHLKTLNLRNNRITKMIKNVHVFEQLHKLETLDMSGNDLQALPYLVFQNLTKLKILDLSKNTLRYQLHEDMYGGSFAGLDNLQTLKLDQNVISDLSPVIFKHLTKLSTLDLSHNRLVHWDHKLFTFTQNLRHLDLAHNKIPVLDDKSLGLNYTSFKTLNVEDNPFACTCDLVWFCGWVNKTKVKIVNYDKYTCDSPRDRQGIKLKNFNYRGLICFDYYPYVIAASVVGSIIVLTLIVMLLYRCRWRISLCCYQLRVKIPKGRDGYQSIPGDDNVYDAYISCAPQEHDFADKAIVQNFDCTKLSESESENSRYRKYQLWFQPSNMQIGSGIIQTMVEAVEQASRAIIVLSNDYLGSARYRMELDFLHDESLRRSFSLIFVTTPRGIQLKLLPAWLHKAFRNSDFLEWNVDDDAQAEFMKKMDIKLRRPPPIRDEQDTSAMA